MKKLISLVLALAMVLMVGAVYAESMAGEFTNGAFTATPEGTVEIRSIGANDSADYFQLVSWDATNGVWQLTTLGTTAGVALADLVDGISSTEAAAIATALADATATGSFSGTGTTRTATVDPGLYYVKATPGSTNTDTVYNPAFVSADYYTGGNFVDFSTAIASSAVLKKSTIDFDKEVTGSDQFVDTKPGDVIPYKITTQIPSYGDQFTNPVFTISDTLSDGLTMVKNSEDALVEPVVKVAGTEITDKTNVYTLTQTNSGFTVAFLATYLTALDGATPAVEITYSAKVTTEALNNVTYMDNKAKLTFSNTPTTTKDQDDITRHYTFSIDANLLGSTDTKTHELIKTGVKADGVTPIYEETVTYHTTPVAPLADAVYTLKQGSTVIGTFTTLSDGHITFKGLDAGTYTLEETTAPSGFVRDTTVYTVKIIPSYTGTNNDILESYKITVEANGETFEAGFTMNNAGESTMTSEPETNSDFFKNTRGTELPSTGGIGTTIFYIVGGLLLVGAAIVLISRRKAND